MSHRDQSISSRARRIVVAGVAAVSVGVLAFTSLSYANEGGGMMHEMHGGPGAHMFGMMGNVDEATKDKHLDRMLSRLIPDATDAQKTSLKTIIKAAGTDLKTLHEQHKTLRTAHLTILTAATVDRTALEQNRIDEARLMDQITKRKNLALADAADVLTAAQRAKVAEHLNAMHQHHGRGAAMKSPFGR